MERRTDYLLILGWSGLLLPFLIGCAELKNQPNTEPSSTSSATSPRLTFEALTYLTLEAAEDIEAQRFHDACSQGDIDTVRDLLNKSVNINVQTGFFNHTCLMLAVSHRFAGLIDLLIKKGAAVNATDIDGRTALHIGAAQTEAQAIVSTLIREGAMVNKKDQRGFTPLHVAAYHGRTVAVKALLEQGANVNAFDTNNATPLYWATQRNHLSTVEVLRSVGGQ